MLTEGRLKQTSQIPGDPGLIRAFISHCPEDRLFVQRLSRDLISQGVQVWQIGSEIRPGESLIHNFEKCFDETEALIVILSPTSIESDWLLQELPLITQGYRGRTPQIVPVILHSCRLPDFFVNKLYID